MINDEFLFYALPVMAFILIIAMVKFWPSKK